MEHNDYLLSIGGKCTCGDCAAVNEEAEIFMDDKKLIEAGRVFVSALNVYKKGNIKPANNLSAEKWLIQYLDEQLEFIKKN